MMDYRDDSGYLPPELTFRAVRTTDYVVKEEKRREEKRRKRRGEKRREEKRREEMRREEEGREEEGRDEEGRVDPNLPLSGVVRGAWCLVIGACWRA